MLVLLLGKNRNIITSINDSSIHQILQPKLIEGCISNAFISSLKSNPDCDEFDFQNDFDLLELIITDEDNGYLCGDVSIEEVKEVVFI